MWVAIITIIGYVQISSINPNNNKKPRYCLVLQKAVTKRGTPQRVNEYKTRMIIAQPSEVYMVEMVRLIKPVRTLALSKSFILTTYMIDCKPEGKTYQKKDR